MLLDEPFAGIDPIAIEEIKELLQEISKKNISILITDHNVRETLSICSRAIILSEGSVIAEGNEESLKDNPHVKQKYFGKMKYKKDILTQIRSTIKQKFKFSTI